MGFYVQSPWPPGSSPPVLVLLSLVGCYWDWGAVMARGSSNFNVHKNHLESQ